MTRRYAVRTKRATQTATIQIKISPEKKAILDELLRKNGESKTDILLECIDEYIKAKSSKK
jgi:predicted DNA-binding protein